MPPSSGRSVVGARRRYLIAYAVSIVIHVVAALFFVLRSFSPMVGSEAPAAEEAISVSRDTIAAERRAIVVPTAAPKPVPVPVPTIVPPLVTPPKHTRAARPHIARSAPRRPELAKITPNGTPVPERISLVAPAVTIPPTLEPSPVPTVVPSLPAIPSPLPATPLPTVAPTAAPTVAPTAVPTERPTIAPTVRPTIAPTVLPTIAPTVKPTVAVLVRTAAPAPAPTAKPTAAPTERPTFAPTVAPTAVPTAAPTRAATRAPSAAPTAARTAAPTSAPAVTRTSVPSAATSAAAVAAERSAAPRPVRSAAAVAASASAGPKSLASPGRAASVDKPGGTAAGTAAKPAAATGSSASAAASSAPKGAVAYVPPRGSNPESGASSGSLNNLNSRLNAALPSSDVSYSHRLYVNDIAQAVEEAQAEYFQKAAPPQGILDRALYIVRQSSLFGPPSIVYVIKKERILGIEICTGWEITQPAGGGDPQGGYTFGPCGGEKFTPPTGMPTLTPKKPLAPSPAPS